jgi:hypothetical protein
MYTYICCRCKNCIAQIVLEEQGGLNTDSFRRPARPRGGTRGLSILSSGVGARNVLHRRK